VNIVVTMAGHGSRFSSAGYQLPKPLIDVGGEPMYARVARCLPLEAATRLVFVCLAEHVEQFRLDDDVARRFGALDARVVALDHVTAGQACTAWAARHELDLDAPVVIHNADTMFDGNLLATMSANPEADGVLGVFEAPGDHWSFARTDATGRVVETAEKRRISTWASTGLYTFASAGMFGELVERAERSPERSGSDRAGELDIAPLYNELIGRGGLVLLDRARRVVPLGTPAELEAYLRVAA
jgi:UDP-N-acetylglucosamine diphosphorylase / glucose-1-phosphate thymidylyltransferase / UDP-N-acetylgalactosamine diphosphorylase / glucosamine-1-phosphate N-acetyltransferase / galactosamine-1-phosphate N-acetyltransferase